MAKKKRRKRRLKKWVKAVLAVIVLSAITFAGIRIYTIYAQSAVDTEYRYVYEKPLVRVDETIRYDMEGGIFYKTGNDEERIPVVSKTLVVSEDGQDFHDIRTDETGRLITGWYEGEDGRYYYTKDHGWLIDESGEIEGRYYELNAEGRVLDHEWVKREEGTFWYEDGQKIGLENEDALLFVEGEEGFYYLNAQNGNARIESDEVFLSDGRRLLYDENGHIRTDMMKQENGPYYCPVPESMKIAEETKIIPVNDLVLARHEETMRSVNHRGYHVEAPENSLKAYMLSYEQGFQYVECDIQFTSDGIPVLLHNETINSVARNADGSPIANMVHISELTYEQVLNYDFGIACGEEYKGLKITSLEAFLAFCKAYGIHPYLEMKGETVDTQAEVDLLMAMVDAAGLRNQVTWISFSREALQFVINRDPAQRLGYLIGAAPDIAGIADSLAAQRAESIDIFLDAALSSDPKIAEICSARGVPLELWTVNNESAVRSLDAYVSGITSDYLHADEIRAN